MTAIKPTLDQDENEFLSVLLDSGELTTYQKGGTYIVTQQAIGMLRFRNIKFSEVCLP